MVSRRENYLSVLLREVLKGQMLNMQIELLNTLERIERQLCVNRM